MQGELAAEANEAARKRAAVELIASHGSALERVARRYSLCAEDAEDAYQRGLEILLTKAPSDRARDLLAWTKTVIKHEALAVRAGRERLLGRRPAPRGGAAGDDREYDWVTRVPASGPGPEERVERREEIAHSREALRALKPAELRALTLLAEGYSYAEIGEITGFSRTKVNRCLAEGRERFRRLLLRSEDGSRCAEMRPLLSAFCDGETSTAEATRVREHLRACGHCRAVARAYRAAPAKVAALAPLLGAAPLTGACEGAAQATGLGSEAAAATTSGAKSVAGAAAGGVAKSAGGTVVAKLAAACAATVGATACVAAGILPSPAGLASEHATAPSIERIAPAVLGPPAGQSAAKRRASGDDKAEGKRRRAAGQGRWREQREPVPAFEPEATAAPAMASPPEPVPAPEPQPDPEPVPAPAPIPPSPPESPAPSGGNAAGEFGP